MVDEMGNALTSILRWMRNNARARIVALGPRSNTVNLKFTRATLAMWVDRAHDALVEHEKKKKAAIENAAAAASKVNAIVADLTAALRIASNHMLDQAVIAERFRAKVIFRGGDADLACAFESLRNQMSNGDKQIDAALARIPKVPT